MSFQESDRRAHDRRPLRIAARVLLPNDQAFEVRTLDIGAGGMGILAGANPKAGTIFAIQFALPSKTGGSASPLQIQVKVANSVLGIDQGGFKIGLQFLGLDPASERIIRQYVK
jgi:c-di-GMP-binding flagellar brake protein YcgR